MLWFLSLTTKKQIMDNLIVLDTVFSFFLPRSHVMLSPDDMQQYFLPALFVLSSVSRQFRHCVAELIKPRSLICRYRDTCFINLSSLIACPIMKSCLKFLLFKSYLLRLSPFVLLEQFLLQFPSYGCALVPKIHRPLQLHLHSPDATTRIIQAFSLAQAHGPEVYGPLGYQLQPVLALLNKESFPPLLHRSHVAFHCNLRNQCFMNDFFHALNDPPSAQALFAMIFNSNPPNQMTYLDGSPALSDYALVCRAYARSSVPFPPHVFHGFPQFELCFIDTL